MHLFDIYPSVFMITTFNHYHNKVHGANTGPTWVLSAPDGSHVGPINLAIRDCTFILYWCICYATHPKKYVENLHFLMLWYWWILAIYFRVALLSLGQSCNSMIVPMAMEPPGRMLINEPYSSNKNDDIDGLARDCVISIAVVFVICQSCTKPSHRPFYVCTQQVRDGVAV